jgi:hypothetical protein
MARGKAHSVKARAANRARPVPLPSPGGESLFTAAFHRYAKNVTPTIASAMSSSRSVAEFRDEVSRKKDRNPGTVQKTSAQYVAVEVGTTYSRVRLLELKSGLHHAANQHCVWWNTDSAFKMESKTC